METAAQVCAVGHVTSGDGLAKCPKRILGGMSSAADYQCGRLMVAELVTRDAVRASLAEDKDLADADARALATIRISCRHCGAVYPLTAARWRGARICDSCREHGYSLTPGAETEPPVPADLAREWPEFEELRPSTCILPATYDTDSSGERVAVLRREAYNDARACVLACHGDPEAVQALVDAARMAQAEPVTLAPRLSRPYADNVREAAKALAAALKSLDDARTRE